MKNHKIFIYFVILGLFALSANFVVATTPDYSNPDYKKIYETNPEILDLNNKIQENKNRIESLKKAAEEYGQKVEEYKDKAANLKNQLGLIDNQVVKIQLDKNLTQLQIDRAKLEIDSLNYQINKQTQEIEVKKQNLIEYIKQVNKEDQKSYLEILILNNSFSEFFNQLDYLQQIQNNIKDTIERLKFLRSNVEVQKADSDRQKKDLEKFKITLEGQEEKLKDDQNVKENILLETRSSEAKFQNLLVETKQTQNEIDSDILNLQKQIKDKISRIRSENTSPNATLVDWPLAPPHIITAYFHDPDYPFRYVFEHPAIDIRAKQGTPIQAPAPGYVARVHNGGYAYSYIILIHDNGISTVYGHTSAIYVKEDTYVKTGDVIGLSGGMPGTRGAGPMTIGPHLHFEVRLNGIPVNPLEYLP